MEARKKKKGFRSREEERFRGLGSKEDEGVLSVVLALFMGFHFKKRENNIIRIKGQKSITSDFPFYSPA